MSKHFELLNRAIVAALSLTVAGTAFAFNSGSTGADGAFNPTVTPAQPIQVPENGIFNYTTVNIPTGVTITYKRNTTNTPVVILATGNVTIAGTIDVSGGRATDAGAAGDGNLGDDGVPGVGGPGGFDGGRGGSLDNRRGGNGMGPGGGGGGQFASDPFCFGGTAPTAGGGGGFGAGGGNATGFGSNGAGGGGPTYGTSQLLPLIGGSGGGGGAAGNGFGGSGGGGGGGAILIAASGTLNITGAIQANGNASGADAGASSGGTGGGGSGGAIRLMATAIAGNGTLNAVGSGSGRSGLHDFCLSGGSGGAGRIRLEAETITRTAGSNPQYPAVTAPTTVFVPGLPTLRIASVAGVNAPATPTGSADITLPANTPNPVTVTFATTGVPVGNTVTLTVVGASTAPTSSISNALSGSTDNATASASAILPSGPSTLQATTTYTIVASLGDQLGVQFAKGERVEKIRLSANLNGPSMTTLITVSGKEYTVPSHLVAAMGG